MSQPNTSGINVFDTSFWDTQRVFLTEFSIKDLVWQGDVDHEQMDIWLEQNVNATDYHIALAKQIKQKLNVAHLSLPLAGENKIKHHFEKMLWLIWGYMEDGWKNPVKGINLLDNGKIHIHPGTHRCVVHDFIDPDGTMPVMVNTNKNQITNFKPHKELETVEDIRNSLVDNGNVLVRTEHEEDLWINGVHDPAMEQSNKDFTYELTGSDSWPNRSLDTWSDLVYKSLPLKIFIGYDSRTPEASKVCEESIHENLIETDYQHFHDSTRHNLKKDLDVDIELIDVKDLQERGLYWRQSDGKESTEFTYTRFLTPYLSEYKGISVFMDCDFMWRSNVLELLFFVNPKNAVTVCKHDYTPTGALKMDGKVQTTYPRKNWSSLMVFNNEHPSVRKLSPELVSTETGMYLHRLQWADDKEIGSLPLTYNWLQGDYEYNEKAKAVHFTNGGPWYEHMKDIEYSDEWREYI